MRKRGCGLAAQSSLMDDFSYRSDAAVVRLFVCLFSVLLRSSLADAPVWNIIDIDVRHGVTDEEPSGRDVSRLCQMVAKLYSSANIRPVRVVFKKKQARWYVFRVATAKLHSFRLIYRWPDRFTSKEHWRGKNDSFKTVMRLRLIRFGSISVRLTKSAERQRSNHRCDPKWPPLPRQKWPFCLLSCLMIP